MAKIKVISDTHGYLPEIGDFDLLIIAGDICPANNHTRAYQSVWLLDKFIPWIKSQKFNNKDSKVVFVPGNHDFVFEGMSHNNISDLEELSENRLKILINEEYDFKYKDGEEVKNIKIFGTPYCKIFGGWAFMRDENKLNEYYSEIPEGVDILVSHDAADLNLLGFITRDVPWGGKNAGNKVLAKYVLKKNPKYYFCGHIHSGNHNFEDFSGIKMANVSYVGEDYKPHNKVLEFEYDEK